MALPTPHKMGIQVINQTGTTDKVFKAYATNTPLKVKVVFDAEIGITGQKSPVVVSTFFVIEKGERPLLGKATAKKLGVLTLGLVPRVCYANRVSNRKPFPSIKGVKVRIPIDAEVRPVIQPLRRVPVALQEKISGKIDELLALEIIESVNEPSAWVSPLVPIVKDNGDLRLCVDMRRANEAIVRENHPLPTMESFLPRLKSAQYFSRLDIKNAFHQLELEEDCRHITTFITDRGMFRYRRLMFGVSCAPEIFQKSIENLLAGCQNTMNYIDDIIIFGGNSKEHDESLRKVTSVLKSHNVLLNAEKCIFKANE